MLPFSRGTNESSPCHYPLFMRLVFTRLNTIYSPLPTQGIPVALKHVSTTKCKSGLYVGYNRIQESWWPSAEESIDSTIVATWTR